MGRIITLIKGMKTEIIKDGKLEQQLFDKYQCWVERSVKESRQTIAESQETLETMENEINRLASEIASETEDIAHKVKSIAANEKSQADATTQRNKENDDFNAESNNDMAKIGALEQTIHILQNNKASTGGQDEGGDDNMALMSQNMKVVMDSVVGDNSISEADKQTVANFARAPAQFFQSNAGRVKAYQSQSAGIIGIMKSMLLATASDLQERTATEVKQTAAYQSLMRTLEEEHENLNNQKDNLEASKAANELQMAENKKTQQNTEELLAETEAFLDATTEAGKEKAKEWALRSQLRLEELKNIDKGIAILSDIAGDDDQAFNNAGDGPAFLQIGEENKLAKIQRTIAEAAMETGSQSLVKMVAASKVLTKSGDWKKAMWRIVEEINRMIKSHREQEAHDIKLRNECETHLTKLDSDAHQAGKQAQRAESAALALKEKQSDNDNTIQMLQSERDADQNSLDELNANAEQATEKMRSDLGAREHAIDALQRAIEVLGAHCTANSFVQKADPEEGQYATDRKKAPKAEFSGANKHCQSTMGLVSILQMVLQDLFNEKKELEKDLGTTASETSEQGQDMFSAIETSNKQIADLEKQNADMFEDQTAKEQMQSNKEGQQDTIHDQWENDKDTCDIVLNPTKWSDRQAERETEIESLQYCKEVLTSGASGNTGNDFLQIRAHSH